MLSKGIIELVANNSETLLADGFFWEVDSWYGINVLRNLLKRVGVNVMKRQDSVEK